MNLVIRTIVPQIERAAGGERRAGRHHFVATDGFADFAKASAIAAVIAAVIAASVASTSFPSQAPKEVQIPILLPTISLPRALGTPHPAPRKSVPDAAPPAIPANVQPAATPSATDTTPHDGPMDDIGVGDRQQFRGIRAAGDGRGPAVALRAGNTRGQPVDVIFELKVTFEVR
jgi:hypothetical protein